MKRPGFPSRLPCAFAVAVAAIVAAASPAAHADEWEKVVSNSTHTVEIDSSVIFNAEHGVKVTWGRIVLNGSEAKRAGYRTIKALNRYDCLGRSFTTVKRVYMDNEGHVVREEEVPGQQAVRVRSKSVDEQIWSKVCGLPLASAAEQPGSRNKAASNDKAMRQISRLADTANRAARNAVPPARAATGEPPRAMRLSAAGVTENAAPQKVAVGGIVTDSPQPPAQPAPPASPAQVTLPNIKPIPMPVAPQNPVAPVTPVAPRQPNVSQTPKRPPDASPPPRREPATRLLILPAPPPADVPVRATRAPVRRTLPPVSHAPTPVPENNEDWSYSGANGPEFWGRLRPEWKLCAEGKRQSPVEFSEGGAVAVNLDPVKFDWRPADFVIINGFRQLRVRIGAGMGMEVRGQRYALEGFALHRPSGRRIGDKVADMEAHFFHRDGRGQIAVLAVSFVRGDKPSAPLQTLLNNLPLEHGDSYRPQSSLDMAAFLPTSPAHYLYMGSLATPPCTEGVLWVVMKEPLTLSDEQAEVFSRLHAENARPPQPVNGRLILESR